MASKGACCFVELPCNVPWFGSFLECHHHSPYSDVHTEHYTKIYNIAQNKQAKIFASCLWQVAFRVLRVIIPYSFPGSVSWGPSALYTSDVPRTSRGAHLDTTRSPRRQLLRSLGECRGAPAAAVT